MYRQWLSDDKMPREAAYLGKREQRQRRRSGQPTPLQTDLDYQRDQVFEGRLLAFLRYLEVRFQAEEGYA